MKETKKIQGKEIRFLAQYESKITKILNKKSRHLSTVLCHIFLPPGTVVKA